MAVPKRKTSPSKRGMRQANQGLSRVNDIVCDNCEMKKLRSLVCKHCGHYRGKQILKNNTKSNNENSDESSQE